MSKIYDITETNCTMCTHSKGTYSKTVGESGQNMWGYNECTLHNERVGRTNWCKMFHPKYFNGNKKLQHD